MDGDGKVPPLTVKLLLACLMGLLRIYSSEGACSSSFTPLFACRAFREALAATAGMGSGDRGLAGLMSTCTLVGQQASVA
eukprot:1145561-Pelagomonas_calceolata.AAC.10